MLSQQVAGALVMTGCKSGAACCSVAPDSAQRSYTTGGLGKTALATPAPDLRGVLLAAQDTIFPGCAVRNGDTEMIPPLKTTSADSASTREMSERKSGEKLLWSAFLRDHYFTRFPGPCQAKSHRPTAFIPMGGKGFRAPNLDEKARECSIIPSIRSPFCAEDFQ